jgi:peptidoglycan/xylan/chitin deacetylase (PgdA/CDA1 family)
MALTFDDGLRSNVEVMYPLLRKLGMPGTFFVCPQLIDERRWLWNVEARKRLQTLASPALAELASEVGAPQDSEAFIEWMKTLELAERQAVEGRIRDASPAFAPNPEMRAACDLATWDELRALDPSVVTIGSHTATHAILSRLTPGQVEEELGGSRRTIEARLGRTADLFCYPNGDQNRSVREAVARHYRAAVSTVPAFVRRGADRFMLPRVDAPAGAVRLCWNMHHRNFFPAPGL